MNLMEKSPARKIDPATSKAVEQNRLRHHIWTGVGEPVIVRPHLRGSKRRAEMGLFKELFAWWTGNTYGTRLFTLRKGVLVGEDELGNRYYRERKGPKRWVIYRDLAEASKVSPEWHGWLHYTVDEPPGEEEYSSRDWQIPHRPNMTGTTGAYRPPGSTLVAGDRPPATGDYEPWRPE